MKMKSGLLAVALLLGTGLAQLANADQVFSTPPGSMAGSPLQSVSASADFSLVGTTLTIKLSDTLAGIQDAGQLLTDVFFTLSSDGTPSLTSQTGDLVDVNLDKKT